MPKNFYKNFLIYLLLGLTALSAKDPKTPEDNNGSDLKSEIKSYILHHLEDSHDFNLMSYTDKISGKKVYIGMPLPVILWDNGIKIFSSTKLNHGKTVVQSGNNFYKLYHGKVYQTDAKGTINYDEKNHPINYKPLDFSITKNVVSILFTALIMFLLFKGLADSYKKNGMIAKGLGRFFGLA